MAPKHAVRKPSRLVLPLVFILPSVLIGYWLYGNIRGAIIGDRVHRAASSTRAVAVAVETYYSQYNLYPPGKEYWGPFDGNLRRMAPLEGAASDPFNRSDPHGWWPTTEGDLQYFTDGKQLWLAISRGPDGKLDLTSDTIKRAYHVEKGSAVWSAQGLELIPLRSDEW